MNYAKRHSYYVKKFMSLLTRNGYTCDKCEYTGMIGDHYTKRDLWGADIIYRNAGTIGFLQVKTSDKQIRKGIKQLTADDNWPPSVQRHVAYWPPRAKCPIFYNIGGTTCQLAPVSTSGMAE